MQELKQENFEKKNFDGITSLWAFNEAGLGGVLHVFKIPFTGLWLSATSVLVLSLISYFSKFKRELLSPFLVVLGVKLAVNPHASLGAYFALAFQGAVAYGLKSVFQNYSIRTFLLSLLAHWYSGLQRLVTLTILFGEPFWHAIDLFADTILKQFGVNQPEFSKLLIFLYLLIYTISAIGVALYAIRLPMLILIRVERGNLMLDEDEAKTWNSFIPKKKKYIKGGLIITALILTCVPLLLLGDTESAIKIILRASLIILLWRFVISPLGLGLIKRWMKNNRIEINQKVERALTSFPTQMSRIVSAHRSYQSLNQFQRIHNVIIEVLTASLYSPKT